MKRVEFSWIARGGCSHPQAMTIRGGSLRAVAFPAMVGVIRHPDAGVLLFDTGYDPAFIAATQTWPERLYRLATPVSFGEADSWTRWLAAAGVDAQEVSGVVVSHFHGDHVAGLHNLKSVPIHCAAAGL